MECALCLCSRGGGSAAGSETTASSSFASDDGSNVQLDPSPHCSSAGVDPANNSDGVPARDHDRSSGERMELQDAIRSLSVYGAVARRRRAVLQGASLRHSRSVTASHTGDPQDFSGMRFRSNSTGASRA